MMKKNILTIILMNFSLFSLALANSAPVFSEDENLLTISAVGDIMIGTNFPSASSLPTDKGQGFFKFSKDYLQSTDLALGNFEGTLFDGEPPADSKKSGKGRYVFRTPVEYGQVLKEAGFHFLSLANNHSKDMGQAGLQSTQQALKELDIQFSSKNGEIATFQVKGFNVAIISFDYYTGLRSIRNISAAEKEIKKLKKNFDIVIISAHVGGEGEEAILIPYEDEIFLGENRGHSVNFARKSIDAGADLIFMHGPHVPRAIEVYKNKLVVYSLGNFATSYGIGISGYAGIAPLVRVAIDKNGNFIKGHLASFKQRRPPVTVWDKEQTALNLIKKLSLTQFPDSAPEFDMDGFFKIPDSQNFQIKNLP